jgi:hypothetical protein
VSLSQGQPQRQLKKTSPSRNGAKTEAQSVNWGSHQLLACVAQIWLRNRRARTRMITRAIMFTSCVTMNTASPMVIE